MSEEIIEIKSFSQEIYQFICKLTKQLSPKAVVPSEEDFCKMLEDSGFHLFVIQNDNGLPVGMLTVVIYQTPSGRKAWIEDVVVDERVRGQGYGKMLMRHSIDYCGNTGANTISLTSNPSRIEANKMYQSLGFHIYETNVYKIVY